MKGFEINTDVSLINPDWEVFADEHSRRYGLAISYLKSVVKGKAYDNKVMRMRVGKEGFYVQSRRFPAAFYGETERPDVSLVSEEEARALVWEAVALYRAGEAQSLTCVYSDTDPSDIFFGYRIGQAERYELGAVRAGLPYHARVMIDAAEPNELLKVAKGVVIYQRCPAGHVILRAAGRRQPFLAVNDLGD